MAGGGANQTSGARGSGASAPLGAPEINPALIWGAVVLLVGGVLILTSRRRRAIDAPKS
jgi:LPXTG-motif cell wall-anchored protein